MNESECLAKMVAPGQLRPSKPYRGGVLQILVTSSCNESCINCTQASQISRKPWYMTPEQFEEACLSLAGYWGVVGVFGGNPAVSKHFGAYCEILRKHFPKEQRGLWCNHPLGWGKEMRETFNPGYSNLNVHLSQEAYDEFLRDWPECHPVGLTTDSRHSPPFVSMKDIGVDESERWELISKCDVNQNWSALLGVFRGSLRAWFCEIAGAQSILHQWDKEWVDDTDPQAAMAEVIGEPKYTYPDTGIIPYPGWWRLPMLAFQNQVRKHCHECGVPLRGHGELANSKDGAEQVSETHRDIYKPKRVGRRVELVTVREQLGAPLQRMTAYLQNSKV